MKQGLNVRESTESFAVKQRNRTIGKRRAEEIQLNLTNGVLTKKARVETHTKGGLTEAGDARKKATKIKQSDLRIGCEGRFKVTCGQSEHVKR
jgi:hypothetical protein